MGKIRIYRMIYIILCLKQATSVMQPLSMAGILIRRNLCRRNFVFSSVSRSS